MRDSHIYSPAATTAEFLILCQGCWRTMRWLNGRTRRSRNLWSKKSLHKTASFMRNRAQRIPSWPVENSPTKAIYICADQPATCIFCLRNGGGPYIYSSLDRLDCLQVYLATMAVMH